VKWERDRWLITHFYPARDAAEMTMPEFLSALENIFRTQKELLPKDPKEIVAEIAEETAEKFKRGRAARQRLLEGG
jgi:hypothetical protein